MGKWKENVDLIWSHVSDVNYSTAAKKAYSVHAETSVYRFVSLLLKCEHNSRRHKFGISNGSTPRKGQGSSDLDSNDCVLNV